VYPIQKSGRVFGNVYDFRTKKIYIYNEKYNGHADLYTNTRYLTTGCSIVFEDTDLVDGIVCTRFFVGDFKIIATG